MVQNWFKGIIDGAWTFMMGSGPDWWVTTEDVVQNVWQKIKNTLQYMGFLRSLLTVWEVFSKVLLERLNYQKLIFR